MSLCCRAATARQVFGSLARRFRIRDAQPEYGPFGRCSSTGTE